jgi:hypothetical protein
VVQALVQIAGQSGVRHDDVEPCERRQACQQIPVGRPQAVAVARPVADGHDDVTIGVRGRRRHEPRAQHVLVGARFGLPRLELAEGRGEKPRLPHQPLRAAVVRGAGLEPPERQPLEGVHVLLVAPERVVEPERLGHQPRPQPERRLESRVARGAARHHGERLALGVAQDGLTDVEPLAEAEDQLLGGGKVWKDNGFSPAVEDGGLDRAHQLRGRGARGDDDEAVARVERRAARRQPDHRTAERLEVRHTNQACRARGDHFRWGSSSRS